jgi:uncharacterized protein
MTLSMSQASAPCFARTLRQLSAILAKAEAHCEARKIDPLVLTSARLFPDMFALARQVQIACDAAKGAVARLAGVEIPKHEDTEKTFAELRERIDRTLAFIDSVPAAKLDGSETREVTVKMRGKDVVFGGLPYLLGFALPNFYFHVVTAYNILRHNGVEIGKSDFLGPQPAA